MKNFISTKFSVIPLLAASLLFAVPQGVVFADELFDQDNIAPSSASFINDGIETIYVTCPTKEGYSLIADTGILSSTYGVSYEQGAEPGDVIITRIYEDTTYETPADAGFYSDIIVQCIYDVEGDTFQNYPLDITIN